MENTYYFTIMYFVLIFGLYSLYINYRLRYLKRKRLNLLYRTLYEYIENNKRITSLCIQISHCFDYNDHRFILPHFASQKPTEKLHSEFYKNESFIGGSFWWKVDSESTKQRKLFILKMIELTN